MVFCVYINTMSEKFKFVSIVKALIVRPIERNYIIKMLFTRVFRSLLAEMQAQIRRQKCYSTSIGSGARLWSRSWIGAAVLVPSILSISYYNKQTVRNESPAESTEQTIANEGELEPKMSEARKEEMQEADQDQHQDQHQENGSEGAFNPDTGEINWDCPCLGGMAHGPCGEEFKQAFSCFVFSKLEPQGIDCIDKFEKMRQCFKQHPDHYKEEFYQDEDTESQESSEEPTVAASESSAETQQKEASA